MKIQVEMDVTPEELRTFFGLPDVRPLQEEMLAQLRERMLAGTAGFDPANLMRPFLTPNLQAMEGLQRAFWQAFSKAGAGDSEDAPKGES